MVADHLFNTGFPSLRVPWGMEGNSIYLGSSGTCSGADMAALKGRERSRVRRYIICRAPQVAAAYMNSVSFLTRIYENGK
jgi:hypothetical protein